MSNDDTQYKKQLFEKFLPLYQIDASYHDQLCEKVVVTDYGSGKYILKNSSDNNLRHYLIQGEIEIRRSFTERIKANAEHEQFRNPMEKILRGSGTVRALSPARVLIVNADFVEELLSLSRNLDYQIVDLNDRNATISADTIDDNYEADWSEAFFQSPLASHISASSMHQLFREMEDIEVSEGEEIFRCQSEAEYFYIVKKGYVSVVTDSRGSYRGETFELAPGSYFGDEALVADTPRNATVKMLTNGVLGRLGKEQFYEIVKKALIIKTSGDEIANFEFPDFIDVRLPIEFRFDRRKQCENIPVSSLRKNLDALDRNKTYIVTPEGGKRSELATYLLRQAGFNAYYLEDGSQDPLQATG